jgi:peptide/nickel transport system permease protein
MTTILEDTQERKVAKRPGLPRRMLRQTARLFSKRAPKAGLILLLCIAIFLLASPLIESFSAYKTTGALTAPPSSTHIFGTDFLGRDVYAEIVVGAGPSLFVAIIAALGSVIIGLFAGVFAGYFSKLHGVIGGLSDLIMIFPMLPLLILLGSLFVANDFLIAELLTLVMWPLVARAIRAQVLSIRNMAFVDAARTSGVKDIQIVFRIIVPEVLSIAVAYFIINVSFALVLTTALQFLGVGNPDVVTWGSILYWAQPFAFIAGAWWWIVAPGAFITLTAIGFALIGFSLEEVFNPRLRAT